MKKVKGLRKKNPHRHQYGDYQREKGGAGKVGESKGGINDDGRSLTWGSKHTVQYTDEIL